MDGMMGKQALVILATLSRLVAEKMDKPFLHITGWVNGRIVIAVENCHTG